MNYVKCADLDALVAAAAGVFDVPIDRLSRVLGHAAKVGRWYNDDPHLPEHSVIEGE